MDFKGDMSVLKNAESSHTSGLQFPDHVSMYLNDEIAHKAIHGPHTLRPFGNLTHTSPFSGCHAGVTARSALEGQYLGNCEKFRCYQSLRAWLFLVG